MDKIKIALVDDHIMVTKGFRNLLSKKSKFEIVGEASNADEAKILVKELRPDVVLMDINMPGDTGITCTKDIKKAFPKTKVIMLTMHHEDQYIHKALSAGADGYVLKNSDVNELIEAIECVHQGKDFFSSTISASAIEEIKLKIANYEEHFSRELTKREIQIIRAISEGLNNKQISERLYISDRTVNTHRTNIMQKMNVKNSVELVVKAMREKLI
jgi:two-component system response regulator NreC